MVNELMMKVVPCQTISTENLIPTESEQESIEEHGKESESDRGSSGSSDNVEVEVPDCPSRI